MEMKILLKFPGGYETELNLNSMSFKKTDSMLPV